jgi:hypothetical protein
LANLNADDIPGLISGGCCFACTDHRLPTQLREEKKVVRIIALQNLQCSVEQHLRRLHGLEDTKDTIPSDKQPIVIYRAEEYGEWEGLCGIRNFHFDNINQGRNPEVHLGAPHVRSDSRTYYSLRNRGSGSSYGRASRTNRNNLEAFLEAVRLEWLALQYASPQLLSDDDLLKFALKRCRVYKAMMRIESWKALSVDPDAVLGFWVKFCREIAATADPQADATLYWRSPIPVLVEYVIRGLTL